MDVQYHVVLGPVAQSTPTACQGDGLGTLGFPFPRLKVLGVLHRGERDAPHLYVEGNVAHLEMFGPVFLAIPERERSKFLSAALAIRKHPRAHRDFRNAPEVKSLVLCEPTCCCSLTLTPSFVAALQAHGCPADQSRKPELQVNDEPSEDRSACNSGLEGVMG